MTKDLPPNNFTLGRDECSQANLRSEVFTLGVDINSSEIIAIKGIPHDSINIDSSEIGRLKVALKRILIH